VLVTKYYSGDHIEKKEMSVASSTYGAGRGGFGGEI